MRGIIYKDLCLFLRVLDRRGLAACGALAVLFIAAGGVRAGMLLSVGLGYFIGALHLLVFEKETAAGWENFQRTLPVSGGNIVAGKYAAVLLTLLPGTAAAAVFNLLFFAVHGRFEPLELGLSLLLAAALPLVLTAVTLPVCYWLGFPAAQYAGMLPFLALCTFFNRIGDGGAGWAPALVTLVQEARVPWAAGLAALAGLFLASLALSAAGYCRREGRHARNPS
ncbi:MAG: ABC-2 transporter permease [Oscillibacter sp.]|nr:ABC-2 transporter permease [Oscillibacter sp.]